MHVTYSTSMTQARVEFRKELFTDGEIGDCRDMFNGT